MAATLLYKEGIWIQRILGRISSIRSSYSYRVYRILNNRHWLFDVIIGAALRILLTDLAFHLVQLIFKKTGDLSNINKYYKLNNTTNLALMKKQMILLGMLMAFLWQRPK